jgi:hypothetical protein
VDGGSGVSFSFPVATKRSVPMQSIPYDPAIVLGNVVDENLLRAVLEISSAGAPVDAAQEELNALLLAKRSLDMTIAELTGMGIDPVNVIRASSEVGRKVADAATVYARATINFQADVVKACSAELQRR